MSLALRPGTPADAADVLGVNTIDELAGARRTALRPAERSLLRDLFPIQPTASGPWG